MEHTQIQPRKSTFRGLLKRLHLAAVDRGARVRQVLYPQQRDYFPRQMRPAVGIHVEAKDATLGHWTTITFTIGDSGPSTRALGKQPAPACLVVERFSASVDDGRDDVDHIGLLKID